MYRAASSIVLILLFFCCVADMSAGMWQSDAIRAKYRQSEIRLLRTDGVRLAGRLISISQDTIVLWTPEEPLALGRNDIASISVKRDLQAGYFLLGGYVGFAAMSATSSSGPGWFLTMSPRYPAYPPLGLGVAALIGALVPVSEGPQETFEINGQHGGQEWRQLEHKVSTLLDDAAWEFIGPFHVSVSGGFVNVPSEVDWPLFSEQGDEESTSSNFTPLRSISLSYSLSEHFDVGLRYTLLNEPQRDNNSHPIEWMYADQTFSIKHYDFKGQALCLAVDARPLTGVFMTPWSFHCGCGAGIGRCTSDVHNQEMNKDEGAGWPTVVSITNHSIDKPGLALSLFGGIDLFVSDDLSVGLAADYTFLPGITLEGMPEWGLPARTAGNFTIGFELGLHF